MTDPTTGVDVLPAVDQGGDILYLSNRRPPVAGVAPVSQDADWTPTSATARGLLDPGPLVSDAAVQRVLDVLRPLLGMGESPSGNRITNWYNQNVEYLASYTWAWCAATISYATTFGGADNIFKDRAYVPFVVQDAQAGTLGSEWHWGSDGMKPGDLAIFDWSGAGSRNIWAADHVGIVEHDLTGGQWTTIEGNIGDALQRVRRDRRYVQGYVRLDWAKADGVTAPRPPAPPASSIPSGLTAPPFPLGWGQYFGPRYPLSNSNSVSGYYSHREDLRRWQKRMIERGWDLGPDGADGYFGPRTSEVARRFQLEKGYPVSGVIWPETWRGAWEAAVTA